ncbi:RNA polymerase sigma-54 factor [Enterococcus alcedinis]|uniref:RNA polymerase sigma-54 factor n=1 Tax=Enterococcus alcedinis TaxID=1274384 RepID=A0A917JBZ7_9ENTE|nr:RNA polymerase factor sigma-54 [Enterococcus alcedinis]MBP2101327.1 RNA polymerase sigma-54 factor [Enterococcus alcedinis]GGI64373.1 RNA polymerase sigma-54 factor [Enterococcus alcedinis]
MKFQQQLSHSQQQNQTQKLAMTQQLQQSIQVLQFSSEELHAFIENEALENPLLGVEEYDYPISSQGLSQLRGDESDYFSQIPDQSLSLFESLIEQVHLNYRDTYLRTLILFLVEYIDLNGFLTITLEEAAEQTGSSAIQMLDALVLLQQLDPAGVGARNLQEALMLQTERDDSAPNLAYIVLEEFFDSLVNRKWDVIAKHFEIRLQDVQEIFDYLQHLTPTPGAIFGDTKDLYIVPDLSVKINGDTIELLSNKKSVPKLIFQQNYFEQMKKSGDKEVVAYLKEKQQNFQILQKMIMQRGDTIYRVGQFIVEHQREFFLNDERPIKPLILKEVAESLDVHESTVSRAVNGKYLATDFGVFELKTFFSHKLVSKTGEESSTDDVKQRLKKIVDQENKQKPLSDQKIVDLLKEEGIELSRRTVAKYREQLGILGSSKRKRYE